jgi:hypothetical protein
MAKLTSVRERINWTTTLTFEQLQPGERRLEAHLDPDVMEIDSSLAVCAVFTSGDVAVCDLSLRCSDTTHLDDVPALHFDSALCESCEKQAARRPHGLGRAILVPPRWTNPLIVEAHHVSSGAKPATLRVMLHGIKLRDVDGGDPVGPCAHGDCQSAPWLSRACREERRRLRCQNWRRIARWVALEVMPSPRGGSAAAGAHVLHAWRLAVSTATAQLRAVTLDDVREASHQVGRLEGPRVINKRERMPDADGTVLSTDLVTNEQRRVYVTADGSHSEIVLGRGPAHDD